jgi:uncharacterized protein with WD repeat
LLWGGEGFHECRRFMHADVVDVLFSPDERYICTWSGYFNNKKPDNAFRVWDLRSMQLLRGFKQQHIDDDTSGFSFSCDGTQWQSSRLTTTTTYALPLPSFTLINNGGVQASFFRASLLTPLLALSSSTCTR